MGSPEFYQGFGSDNIDSIQADYPRYNVREIADLLLGVQARVEVTEDLIARELDDLGQIPELASGDDDYLDVEHLEEQWQVPDKIVELHKLKQQLDN